MSVTLKNAVAPVLALGMAIVLAELHYGCKVLAPTSPAEVDAAYTAETLGCVERATTRYESCMCRKDVNMRYGLCDQSQWPNLTPCDVDCGPRTGLPKDAGGQ